MPGRADYRDLLTKGDILTIRMALREAIFLYSQPGTPASEKPRMEKFKVLLKKIRGAGIQQMIGFPRVNPEAQDAR